MITTNLSPMKLEAALSLASHIELDSIEYKIVSWDMNSETLYYMNEDSDEEYSSKYDDLRDLGVVVKALAIIEML
jgi:hypothetical protein